LEPTSIPPPKILLFGSSASRRSDIGRYIAEKHKLRHISARQLIRKYRQKHNPGSQDGYSQQEIVGALQSVNHAKGNYLLEIDDLATIVAGHINQLFSNKTCIPDCCIVLTTTPESFMKRRYKEPTMDSVKLPLGTEEEEQEMTEERSKELREAALKEAIEERKEEVNSQCQSEQKSLEGMTDLMAEFNIPVIEIDDNRKESITQYLCEESIRKYTTGRSSLFSFAAPMEKEEAIALLAENIVPISKFGKYCPVEAKNAATQLVYTQDYPVWYKSHIYFLASEKNRRDFVAYPEQFIHHDLKLVSLPIIPVSCIVLGPPKAGKTTLCKQLEQQIGVVRLTMTILLRKMLLLDTVLAKQIAAAVKEGSKISDELYVKAIKYITTSVECQKKGYVKLSGEDINICCAILLSELESRGRNGDECFFCSPQYCGLQKKHSSPIRSALFSNFAQVGTGRISSFKSPSRFAFQRRCYSKPSLLDELATGAEHRTRRKETA
jgi:adenylate kinase family enzyme